MNSPCRCSPRSSSVTIPGARGYSGAQYCPACDTARAEMATFIFRASSRLTPIPGSPCADVTRGAAHSEIINALAAAGVTLGCTTDRYCPRSTVTRAEIANILARAFPG